jgi:hypothetical protein
MVQIIRSLGAGPDRPAPMRFKVYMSPKDRQTVLGYVEPYGIIHGNSCTWLQTPFCVPVAEAYAHALELAGRAGVPVLWIDDPEGLFSAPQAAA